MFLRNHLSVAISRVLAPVQRVCESAVLRGTEQAAFRGLPVHVQSDLADVPTLTARMVSALQLLAEYDPRRCARVRCDLRCIYVNIAVGPALWRATRTCVLPAKMVRETSPEWLASIVVHEATHARLGWRRGRRNDTILALETCCVRAQMAFLRRLPVAGCPQRDELLAYLSQATLNPWWKGRGWMLRQREGLAELGAPEWVQYFFTAGYIAKKPPNTPRDAAANGGKSVAG